jgi:hypothetical protein
MPMIIYRWNNTPCRTSPGQRGTQTLPAVAGHKLYGPLRLSMQTYVHPWWMILEGRLEGDFLIS